MGSALHAACHGGHLSLVHLLLQAGADPDTLDRDQNTPLMLACAAAHNPVVKYLVKAGASVTLRVSNFRHYYINITQKLYDTVLEKVLCNLGVGLPGLGVRNEHRS